MKNENAKQVCTNCKYFKRHYIISNNGRFTPTISGHCVNIDMKYKTSSKHVKYNDSCELWQPYELQKLNIKYGIEHSLQNISDRVTEILEVLRNVE